MSDGGKQARRWKKTNRMASATEREPPHALCRPFHIKALKRVVRSMEMTSFSIQEPLGICCSTNAVRQLHQPARGRWTA